MHYEDVGAVQAGQGSGKPGTRAWTWAVKGRDVDRAGQGRSRRGRSGHGHEQGGQGRGKRRQNMGMGKVGRAGTVQEKGRDMSR